jgi:hypothetical protein
MWWPFRRNPEPEPVKRTGGPVWTLDDVLGTKRPAAEHVVTDLVDLSGDISAGQIRGAVCVFAVFIGAYARTCEGVARGEVKEGIALIEDVGEITEDVLDLFSEEAQKTFEIRFDRARKSASDDEDEQLSNVVDLAMKIDQAATLSSVISLSWLSSSVTLMPSLNFAPSSTSATSSWPLSRRQRSCADSSSL